MWEECRETCLKTRGREQVDEEVETMSTQKLGEKQREGDVPLQEKNPWTLLQKSI